MVIYITMGILSVAIIVGISINNQIIALKNQEKQAFGNIEIYLKKRFDLIPYLVATLNNYIVDEKEIFLKVTALRTNAKNATYSKEKIKTSNQLTQVVSDLNLQVENYPNLKADQQFEQLNFELADIEDQISAAGRAYNASVNNFNTKIQLFPASIVAAIRKDQTAVLLDIPETAQKEVNVNPLFHN